MAVTVIELGRFALLQLPIQYSTHANCRQINGNQIGSETGNAADPCCQCKSVLLAFHSPLRQPTDTHILYPFTGGTPLLICHRPLPPLCRDQKDAFPPTTSKNLFRKNLARATAEISTRTDNYHLLSKSIKPLGLPPCASSLSPTCLTLRETTRTNSSPRSSTGMDAS
jgi:hypothetical protein